MDWKSIYPISIMHIKSILFIVTIQPKLAYLSVLEAMLSYLTLMILEKF